MKPIKWTSEETRVVFNYMAESPYSCSWAVAYIDDFEGLKKQGIKRVPDNTHLDWSKVNWQQINKVFKKSLEVQQ